MGKFFIPLIVSIVFFTLNAEARENRLRDSASIVHFTASQQTNYDDFIKHLLDEFDIDFMVYTTNSDEDINAFSNKLFRRLQKNSLSKSGQALLFVINPAQDKARLEVSLALEHIYTDAFVSYIQNAGIVPYFKNNKVSDGVFEMAALVHDRAYEAKKGKKFTPRAKSESMGAGAKVKANIGKGQKVKSDDIKSESNDTPLMVLQKYLAKLKAKNNNPNLGIYTKKTREFFNTKTSTEINMDNEIRFLSPCINNTQTIYSFDEQFAVILDKDPLKNPTCSPYFFKKEDGAWRLDFATMADVIRFNTEMKWHFDMQNRLKNDGKYYAFGFDGYVIYFKNGYIYEAKEKKPEGARWGYECGQYFDPKDKDLVRQNPRKYIKCYMKRVWGGSPAMTRLGLQGGESILSIGEGVNKKDNVSFVDFMSYMKNAPTGSIVTLKVQLYKSEKTAIIQGIAP